MSVIFSSPAALAHPVPYHHVSVGTGPRHVHVAGQVGQDSDGVLATGLSGQVAQALRNVSVGLAGAGGSFHDVLRLTFYVTGWRPEMMENFMAGVDQVGSELGMPGLMPPASLIGVAALFSPDVLVEVEAIAILD